MRALKMKQPVSKCSIHFTHLLFAHFVAYPTPFPPTGIIYADSKACKNLKNGNEAVCQECSQNLLHIYRFSCNFRSVRLLDKSLRLQKEAGHERPSRLQCATGPGKSPNMQVEAK